MNESATQVAPCQRLFAKLGQPLPFRIPDARAWWIPMSFLFVIGLLVPVSHRRGADAGLSEFETAFARLNGIDAPAPMAPASGQWLATIGVLEAVCIVIGLLCMKQLFKADKPLTLPSEHGDRRILSNDEGSAVTPAKRWAGVLPSSEWNIPAPHEVAMRDDESNVSVTKPSPGLAIRFAGTGVGFVLAVASFGFAAYLTGYYSMKTAQSTLGLFFGAAMVGVWALAYTFGLVRAFAFNPLRALGRWAIIADPEKIEIPNWIRGTRTFRWERSTLVIIGVYGLMARAAVVDRDTGDTVAFNLPRANLDTLVGVATARDVASPAAIG